MKMSSKLNYEGAKEKLNNCFKKEYWNHQKHLIGRDSGIFIDNKAIQLFERNRFTM